VLISRRDHSENINNKLKRFLNSPKMILLTGDSNYREVYSKYKKRIEEETKESLVFRQYTSNESLKLVLSDKLGKEDRPKVFIIGAGLNELAAKAKSKKKGRDDLVRTVANEQNTVVLKQAEKDNRSLFGMTPPFLRMDPAWMAEKYSLLFFYMRDFSLKFNSGNMYVGSPIVIEETDLKDDKVHLNEAGLAKLVVAIISDAKTALKDVEILRNGTGSDEDLEMESSQLSNWAKTPETTRKRTREDENEIDTAPSGKRTRERDNETVTPVETASTSSESVPSIPASESSSNTELIATLHQFMQQMREDRRVDSDTIRKVELSQNTIVEKQKETDEKVEKLTDIVMTDNEIFASMKEDVDASENETMRNTVVVKKLVIKEKLPTDKKDIPKFIQTQGRALVKQLMGEESEKEVKFVSTLFMKDRSSPAPDEPTYLPPFKLVFKTKEAGMRFREEAVKVSKEGKEGFEKTYFTHQQNAATRIRTSLMWGVVAGLKKKGKEAWVNQNLNKPNIQIKENGKIVKTLTFIQAMKEHSKLLSAKVLSDVTKSASWNFSGQMERYFLVLKD